MVKRIDVPVRTDAAPDPVTNEQTGQADTSAGQVESLAALGAEAAAIDNPAAEPGQDAATPTPAEQPATVADVVDLLEMGKAMAAPAVEMSGFLKPGQIDVIWSKDALTRIAKPLVSIMNRYDMSIIEAMEKYLPWVMLLGGIAGPAFATYKAVKDNIAEAHAKQQLKPA